MPGGSNNKSIVSPAAHLRFPAAEWNIIVHILCCFALYYMVILYVINMRIKYEDNSNV
jgi:hypothetical protein